MQSIKQIILLLILCPIAHADYRTLRIPNQMLIFGVLCRAILIPFEYLTEGSAICLRLSSEIFAAVSVLAAALLCVVFVKESIGFGDIKLLMLMALFLESNILWNTILTALILSLLASLYLLLIKGKSIKTAIPFAPSVTIAVFLSIVFM